jgi:hypothetical protein
MFPSDTDNVTRLPSRTNMVAKVVLQLDRRWTFGGPL